MPASLTHYYFAKNVLESLPDRDAIYAPAYYWGAQGPDFLFCHHYMSFLGIGKDREILKKYGNRLHSTKPSQTLAAMRDYGRKHPDSTTYSYVRGFLCHYALDSAAHPYVNALAATLAAERPSETLSTMHGEIESALDAIILRRETGRLPSEVNLKHLFPGNEAVQRRMARLYRQVLQDVYGADIPEQEIFQATKDAHFVFAAITDRTGLKRRLFHLLEQGKPHVITSHIVPLMEEDGIDYANIQESPWGPDGCTQNFFQLYEQAQDLARELINHFEDGDLAAMTGERPFG